jgi:two-component system sensor histidine kinase KdpD
VVGTSAGLTALGREEELLAEEALAHRDTVFRRPGSRVGRRTLAAPGEADTTFVPILTGPGAPAVLRLAGILRPPEGVPMARLLASFANEASVALHRAHLQEEAREVAALRRADEFKSALLSSVSHDLRSPLTAVKAAVGSLRDESLPLSDDDRKAFLATIETQTDRLTSSVTNLLEMSRLEGGAVTPSLERLEARALLEEVVAATAQATAGRDVRVEGPPEVWLRADYGLMMQALTNLVENAARYSTPGAPISLVAAPEDGLVTLTVSDEGPGIPAADLPHVFEKFYRGQGKSRGRGTGLGLSIVKAMAELCGGTVNVSSSPQGTTFSITLPAAMGAAE